uniref:Uncharacterized protein n=1 Tax=Arundo donax TaxID=35708 RepID=A0A0A8ZMD6_ARUDO
MLGSSPYIAFYLTPVVSCMIAWLNTQC